MQVGFSPLRTCGMEHLANTSLGTAPSFKQSRIRFQSTRYPRNPCGPQYRRHILLSNWRTIFCQGTKAYFIGRPLEEVTRKPKGVSSSSWSKYGDQILQGTGVLGYFWMRTSTAAIFRVVAGEVWRSRGIAPENIILVGVALQNLEIAIEEVLAQSRGLVARFGEI
ncbi:hypothetical protein BDZ45DRAFT_310127 [Acephala macrosclerotiorum]|nr:hypothetical protein BDZ45DRAFT_310127 [Acephala macrosclerotiorum]